MQSNPSSYLIDGGLWTACRESFLATKRAYCGGNKHVGTGHFIRDQDNDTTLYQLFTVLPRQDLFLFQVPELREYMCGLERMPPLHIWQWGVFGLRNIAYEFDRRWQPADTWPGPRNVFTEILCASTDIGVGKLEAVWLVDYSLKHANGYAQISPPSQKGNRAIFHGSNNCRFVEVLAEEADGGDTPWFCDDSGEGSSRGSLSGSSSFDFVAALTRDYEKLARLLEDRVRRDPESGWTILPPNFKYGVLAFECH